MASRPPSNPLDLLQNGYRLAEGPGGRRGAESRSQFGLTFEDPEGNPVQYHGGGTFSNGYCEAPHYHIYTPLSGGGYAEVLSVPIGDLLMYWTW